MTYYDPGGQGPRQEGAHSADLLLSRTGLSQMAIIPTLKCADLTCRGTDLMPSLMEFLKSKGSEEEEKKTALISVLREINNALQKSSGPYFGGEDVNAADLRVAPQIKHVIIGTKTLKVENYPLFQHV